MSEAATGAATAAAEASLTSTIATLEALQKQSSYSRRLRPPHVSDSTSGDEIRVPLRADPEKLSHRESRLGLRSLFAKNKAAVQDVRASIVDFSGWPYSFHGTRSETVLSRNAPSPQEVPEPQQPVLSTPDLQTRQALRQPPEAPTTWPVTVSASAASSSKPKKPSIPLRSRTPAPSTRTGRGSLATWDPPPLFQAYPQAIKHAQLPTCTTSVDALLRLQGHRYGSSISGGIAVRESLPSDSADDGSAGDKPDDKSKRKHHRNTSGSSLKLDWQNKIYVLVTSGYLLQYAAEGSFDRLPEKILPIGRDSAAFASDLIPGRHWVLRVCSAMGADGIPTNDSRSLFSRLPFRGSERRHASTLLMVFESAEEMESWITILRREIEHFGGKKHMSETGKPKLEHTVLEQSVLPSQRTLVVRDPERFSRVLSPHDLPHIPRRRDSYITGVVSAREGHPEALLAGPSIFQDRDPMNDDMSTTTSIYSQDGRQLENLRDSSNRFSYISSGQRTMVTSDSSSPPCTPVRDSFASNRGDEPLSLSDSPNEARPRPNAAAIIERRQSMQALTADQRVSDMHLTPSASQRAEPQPRLPISSFCITSPLTKPLPSPVPLRRETNFSLHSSQGLATSVLPSLPSIPNFSVPHLASKRYSAVVKSPAPEPTPDFLFCQQVNGATEQQTTHLTLQPPPEARPHYAQAHPGTRSNTRRLPPPSLAFSRPLSIVTDHPSPGASSPPLSRDVSNASLDDSNLSSPGYGSDVPDTPSIFAPWTSPDKAASQGHSRSPSPATPIRNPRSDMPTIPQTPDVAQIHVPVRKSPRRHSSMLVLRSPEAPPDRIETRTFVVPFRGTAALPISKYASAITPSPNIEPRKGGAPQSRSGPNSFTRHQSQSPPPESQTWRPAEHKRASMFVQSGTRMTPPRPSSLYHPTNVSKALASHTVARAGAGGSVDTGRGRTPAKPEPLGPRTSAPNVHLRARSTSSKAVLYRRSMPQLADGPPPAPPPTCALPPLPARPSDLDTRRRILQI